MKLKCVFFLFIFLCITRSPILACYTEVTSSILYQESGSLFYAEKNLPIPATQALLQIDTLILHNKDLVLVLKNSDAYLFSKDRLINKCFVGDSLKIKLNNWRLIQDKGQLHLLIQAAEDAPLGKVQVFLVDVNCEETISISNKPNNYFANRFELVGTYWFLIIGIVAFLKLDFQIFREALLPQKYLTKSDINELSGPRYRLSTFHILAWIVFAFSTFVFFKITLEASNQRLAIDPLTQTVNWIGIHIYIYVSSILVGILISNGNLSRFHTSQSIRISAVLSVILTLLTVIFYFGQILEGENFMKWQRIAIYIYAFVRFANVLLSLNKATSIFELTFISYLCATEILPLGVLLGTVYFEGN